MAETVVDLRNVWFTYDGENYAVKDVSFRIPRGEFAAIIGNNGSGKTTLLKLILGLLKPTRGEVWVAGVNTKNAKVSELAKRIGLVFQNPNGIFRHFPVTPCCHRRRRRNFFTIREPRRFNPRKR